MPPAVVYCTLFLSKFYFKKGLVSETMTDKEIYDGYDDEEMTVELELDDGQIVNCAVITILTVDKKDYIALLPLDEDGNNDDGEVWFYQYEENENDPNEEPKLTYIDDDEEYENVADAFDEYLDNAEFDEIVDVENE